MENTAQTLERLLGEEILRFLGIVVQGSEQRCRAFDHSIGKIAPEVPVFSMRIELSPNDQTRALTAVASALRFGCEDAAKSLGVFGIPQLELFRDHSLVRSLEFALNWAFGTISICRASEKCAGGRPVVKGLFHPNGWSMEAAMRISGWIIGNHFDVRFSWNCLGIIITQFNLIVREHTHYLNVFPFYGNSYSRPVSIVC